MSLSSVGKLKNYEGEDYTLLQIGPSTMRKPISKEEAKQPKEEKESLKAKAEQKQKPMTARQRHKMEKIKKKYRDQDDEEREMRMLLLGSKPKQSPVQQERKGYLLDFLLALRGLNS